MNVFITGGTSGIGLALSRHYLDRGHRVGAYALHPPVDEPRMMFLRGDVRDATALADAVRVFTGQGVLDLLIACAGINHGFELPEWPDFARHRLVLEVNLLGVVNAFDAALQAMPKTGPGHLVAIASASGFFGVPGHGGYTASKAGVLNLCEALAIELARHRITVTCVAPGFVDTPLMANNPDPMPFRLEPERAANAIAAAIAARRELLVFPWPIAVLSGVLRLMPRRLYRSWYKRAYERRMARGG